MQRLDEGVEAMEMTGRGRDDGRHDQIGRSVSQCQESLPAPHFAGQFIVGRGKRQSIKEGIIFGEDGQEHEKLQEARTVKLEGPSTTVSYDEDDEMDCQASELTHQSQSEDNILEQQEHLRLIQGLQEALGDAVKTRREEVKIEREKIREELAVLRGRREMRNQQLESVFAAVIDSIEENRVPTSIPPPPSPPDNSDLLNGNTDGGDPCVPVVNDSLDSISMNSPTVVATTSKRGRPSKKRRCKAQQHSLMK